jgi:hypothetical protein
MTDRRGVIERNGGGHEVREVRVEVHMGDSRDRDRRLRVRGKPDRERVTSVFPCSVAGCVDDGIDRRRRLHMGEGRARR